MQHAGGGIRRYFRFSLRSFLIAVTLSAIWFGTHLRRANIQRDAVKAISDYGGWVRYSYQFPSGSYHYKDFDANAVSPVPKWLIDRVGVDFFHGVVQVNLNYTEDGGARQENHNPSDDALEHVGKLSQVRVLLLSDTQASDESLVHLRKLRKLERLYMWDVVNVSDDGVRHLEPLKELRYVHLSHSKITDASMTVFATLPKLEGLSLQENQFTNDALKHIQTATKLKSLVIGLGAITVDDDGLPYLKRLTNLEKLGLQSSDVSEAGMVHLEGLSNLKTLWVDEGAVAGPGLERLKAKRPALKVE